jgi:hypothetical protein
MTTDRAISGLGTQLGKKFCPEKNGQEWVIQIQCLGTRLQRAQI